jgi:hypothetical protein
MEIPQRNPFVQFTLIYIFKKKKVWVWWPTIPATWEVKIERTAVQGWPGKKLA